MIWDKPGIKANTTAGNKIETHNNSDDYLFSPILNNLEKELKKEKPESEQISDMLQKLRNTLMQNLELIDIEYEAIDEEFQKYYRGFNEVKFKELSNFIKLISKNSIDKENIIRKEEQARMEKRGGVILNDLMVYDRGFPSYAPEIIAIHVSPNKTISSGRKLVLLREGLRKLAQVVENTPTIKSIEGESWIIRDYPDLIKKMGFKIDPQILTRIKEFFERTPQYLKKEGIAKISRKDFLERYLNKQN